MKTRILKLLLAVVLFVLPQIGITYSYFTDEATVGQNVITAGCWVKPEAPRMAYPENNYVANLGSDWLTDSYMDWGDSVTTCPTGSITYIYESYHDSGLTSLAYQSPPLSSSIIPAPGTPDGTYYWRVKAFDGTTWSDWSEVWLLTVNRTPPVPPPSSPDVVINEVMWMGSIVHRLDEVEHWDVVENNYGTPQAANLSENDPTSLDFEEPTITPTPSPTPEETITSSSTPNP
jgi:predicted ribosomally synthesized peptide with SipW-like signal peptide